MFLCTDKKKIMIHHKLYNFLRKNLWTKLLLFFSVTGAIFGVWGFMEMGHPRVKSFYETIRLFVINPSFSKEDIPWQLESARWLILVVFILFTFRLFFEILAPQFIKNLIIKLSYRNHIIICGLNKITINLIERFENEKIIVLSEETNKYSETLKTKGKKLLTGNFTDENFWKKAKLKSADKLYTVIDNDKINVKIAQAVFSHLKNRKRKNNALKCFVLMKDNELKTILEETTLFKYKTDTFDGFIFSINEMGIKYGIAMNIDKILPEKIETVPKILLVGLTEKTEIALLNLTHCLTMQQEEFEFTIVEENEKTKDLFRKKYAYLWDFAKINFVEEIKPENQYDSILICSENSTEAIKQAFSIRNTLAKSDPNILIFCDSSDTFSNVLEKEGNHEDKKEIYTLKDRNIVLINLFEEIAHYIFDLESEKSIKIEEKAKESHYFWNVIYKMDKEWDTMSGHFKQSNRNQVLDNYLRTYIVFGEKFENMKNRLVSFSDKEKETLAIMEHRRWMLEKYANGWTTGTRNDEFKQHDCLIHWNKLPKKEQLKDYDAINLMIRLLTNQLK